MVRDETERLSEHFSLAEFRCPCCGKARASAGLIGLLEEIRAAVGRPVYTTVYLGKAGGFRCKATNDALVSAGIASPRSRHLTGDAADIYVKGMSMKRLYDVCDRINTRGGVGLYSGHVHVDYRPLRVGEAGPRWTA